MNFCRKQPIPKSYEDFASFWKDVKDGQPVGAVLIDTDLSLNMAHLIRAQLYLNNPDCLFIVGTTDMMLSLAGHQLIGNQITFKSIFVYVK